MKMNAGVRVTAIDGNNLRLKQSLKEAIDASLKKAGRSLEKVEAILASGMITSNLGLIEIPHLTAPVGIAELAEGIVAKRFSEIVDQPIYFIPGVKNAVENDDWGSVENLDMMRGEEAESLGAGILQGIRDEFVFISPGSHTKFVFIDEEQRIQSCCTTLTGELLAAISGNTILADSLSDDLIQRIEPRFIKMGIDAAKKCGLTKACFQVRVLDTLRETTENERANYLAGALAYNDILALLSRVKANGYVMIGGNPILQKLYEQALLFLGWSSEKICLLNKSATEQASSALAIELYERLVKKS